MSEVTISCPHCGASLTGDPAFLGQEVGCPDCGKDFIAAADTGHSAGPGSPHDPAVSKNDIRVKKSPILRRQPLPSAAPAPAAAPAGEAPASGKNNNPRLRRARLFLETGDFEKSREYCEQVLDNEPENGEAYSIRLLAEQKICKEEELVGIEGLEENKTFRLARRFADPALASKFDGILQERVRIREEKKAAEEAERRRRNQILFILKESNERTARLSRYMTAELSLRGNSDLYNRLLLCSRAEDELRKTFTIAMQENSPSPDNAAAVKKASEDAMAQAGDLEQLEKLAGEKLAEEKKAAEERQARIQEIRQTSKAREKRLAEEKKRQDRERYKKIGLIVTGVVVLSIIIITFWSVISKRNYINAELTQARAAMKSAQWSEAIAHTENVLSRDAENAEAKNLLEEVRREEAKRWKEARREEAKKRREEKFQTSLPGGVLHLPDDVKLELVRVEAGTFTMGARDGENYDNEKEHRVTLTRDFYLGKTEVTQAQWRAVMGNDPSYLMGLKGDDLPVKCVSWYEAMEFCKKLNEMGTAPSGWQFTLPTEAQWEYAARGGNKSRGYKYSGSNDLGEVAWYDGNSGYKTHPVAQKRPNELGLYDMSGNVMEWCLDRYGSYRGDATDPTGPSSGWGRVDRGGSWDYSAWYCRSARRGSDPPGHQSYSLGFRLAVVPVQ